MLITVLRVSNRNARICAYALHNTAHGIETNHEHRTVSLRELSSIPLLTGVTLRSAKRGECNRPVRLNRGRA